MTREKETFTMLYLLGPDGKAEGYPTESLINVPLNVSVGIENHELEDVNYVLQMRADGEVIEELNISLKDRETWQKNMTYIRQKLKTGRSKLEFALFKDNPYNFPYRSVHLYLENNNNLAYVDKHNYTEVPVIENGDMESSTGWNFTSNTDKVTGSYVNGSGVESSYAYRIINSNTKNPFGLPEYGEISQDVKCKGNTMVLLSAFVKGDSNSSRGADNQIKQITVNGETVWTDRISRDEVWKHIEVPISLQAGSNNLVFGLTQISGKIYPVEVLWDNIALKPLTEISNVSENGTVKTTSQNLSVVKPPVTRPAEVKLDITPNPCKNATNFTVACSIPLQVAVCLVTPDGFEPDSIELKSTDGVIWTGSYVIKHGKHFYVEALCTDTYGNTTSTFDEITVDKSLPDFLIEINPKTIDSGDLEIKVTPSNALKKQPSVSIFANKTVNITYMSYSDGTYLYKAKIDSETNEGEHKISVTGYDPDSKKVQDNTTFIIDHPG